MEQSLKKLLPSSGSAKGSKLGSLLKLLSCAAGYVAKMVGAGWAASPNSVTICALWDWH